MRIVSLLPSATEIVYALGLGDHLVGVSHECDFPPAARTKQVVTRSLLSHSASSAEIDRAVREHSDARQPLYALDGDAVERLAPDLIITQSLCNVCAVSERDVEAAACRLPTAPNVLNLEARTFADVLGGIRLIAAHTGTDQAGRDLIDELERRTAAVTARTRSMHARPTVAFIEWLDPPFCAGHWNPELVEMAGGNDPLGRPGQPAKSISWGEVERIHADVVFIACCGFDVERTLQDLAAAPLRGQVFVTDGSQYFSRPGPRIVDSLEILAHAIDPHVHPKPAYAPSAMLSALPQRLTRLDPQPADRR